MASATIRRRFVNNSVRLLVESLAVVSSLSRGIIHASEGRKKAESEVVAQSAEPVRPAVYEKVAIGTTTAFSVALGHRRIRPETMTCDDRRPESATSTDGRDFVPSGVFQRVTQSAFFRLTLAAEHRASLCASTSRSPKTESLPSVVLVPGTTSALTLWLEDSVTKGASG